MHDAAVADAQADVVVDSPPDVAPSPCDLATTAEITTLASFTDGRYAPVAFKLPDGRPIVAGGFDFQSGIQFSAQIIDPHDGTLTDVGPLNNPRNFATISQLADATFLVTGGFDPMMGSLRLAERFDPSTLTFTAIAALMTAPREAHTATVLPDGTVFIVGGLQAMGLRFHDSAEQFDPTTNHFAAITARMTSPRGFHASVYLPMRNAVLIVGGDSGHGELASAERFNVAQGTFEATANPRAHAGKAVAAVMLRDGRVLVTGGANAMDGTLADADLYDPTTDRFTPAAPMHTRRMAHTLTLLDDGRVLAAGGWSDTTSPAASAAALEVYDPIANRWDLLPVSLAAPRHDHRVVLLDDCRAMIVGGQHVVGSGAPAAPLEIEVLTVPHVH